jgi:hypothetical protein
LITIGYPAGVLPGVVLAMTLSAPVRWRISHVNRAQGGEIAKTLSSPCPRSRCHS